MTNLLPTLCGKEICMWMKVRLKINLLRLSKAFENSSE